MAVDFNLFQTGLPQELLKLMERFNEAGFRAGVIGGVPRDFLLSSKIGDDFDLELRPVEEELYLERFVSMAKSMGAREKGFKVFELRYDHFSVEFGLPRVEIFNGEVHHSNFKAKHISDQDYSEGFKRRDFTVNAILFEYWKGKWKLIDPLHGVDDLQARLLSACDHQSFVKDPVRFLRALRFSLKLNFRYDQALLTLLKNMALAPSPHYLKTEAQKSLAPMGFLLECSRIRNEHFPFEFLEAHSYEISEYERKFVCEELKKHVGQALFLKASERRKLLDVFQLSSKGMLELDLKEVNLGKVKDMGPSEISRLSWVKPLLELFTKVDDYGEKKLEWLLNEEEAGFDTQFIRQYNAHQVDPELVTEYPAQLRRFAVFKEKILALF